MGLLNRVAQLRRKIVYAFISDFFLFMFLLVDCEINQQFMFFMLNKWQNNTL